MAQLKVFYSKKVNGTWASNGCKLPLLAMMGGSSQSVYPPFRHDPYAPENSGGNRSRPRIALLFDEEDIVRSNTGNGALDKILFKPAVSEFNAIGDAVSDSIDSVYDKEAAYADGAAAAFRNGLEVQSGDVDMSVSASQKPLSLRDAVAAVYCYSATPGATYNDIGDDTGGGGRSSSGVSEAKIHAITLATPPGYCGYNVGMARHEGWRRRNVRVVQMEDRADNLAQTITKFGLTYFQRRGFEFGEVPEPFSLTANGVLRLNKKDENDLIEFPDDGEVLTAKKVKEMYTAAAKIDKKRPDKFKECDGPNIERMGEDMVKVADPPRPHRPHHAHS